jgi:hypothetical protein
MPQSSETVTLEDWRPKYGFIPVWLFTGVPVRKTRLGKDAQGHLKLQG